MVDKDTSASEAGAYILNLRSELEKAAVASATPALILFYSILHHFTLATQNPGQTHLFVFVSVI